MIRRTPFAFYYPLDNRLVAAVSLLRSDDAPAVPELIALALLTGARHAPSRAEFDLIMSLPSEQWVPDALLDRALVGSLLDKALLVSDADEPWLSALRRRDEALSDAHWNLYGALYRYMTLWTGSSLDSGDPDAAEAPAANPDDVRQVIARCGVPPPPVAERRTETEVPLLPVAPEGDLYRVLLSRRTVRGYDLRAAMTLEQLSTLLCYGFGFHGYAESVPEVPCMKRTSPSGGGASPGRGVPHHQQRSGRRTRYLPLRLPPPRARPGRTLGSSRSSPTGDVVHVRPELLRLGARLVCPDSTVCPQPLEVSPPSEGTAAILMDTAHLSQTLYLVSTDLGLGAFVTLAINGREAEDRLGLDGINEGVIAMTGCGVAGAPPRP